MFHLFSFKFPWTRHLLSAMTAGATPWVPWGPRQHLPLECGHQGSAQVQGLADGTGFAGDCHGNDARSLKARRSTFDWGNTVEDQITVCFCLATMQTHVACGCRSSGLKLDGLKFSFFVWHLTKMASRLRLTYFDDNKGRNELTRLIFAVGQISFEDELIGFPEYLRRRDAAALPFDQIPTLRVGDTVLGQSCAIARYAARLAKLYPEDPLTASVADAVVDSWRDQLDLLYDTFFERTVIAGKLQMFPRQQHERAWRIRVYLETSFRPWMMQMERKLMQGRFCPPDLTYAELAVFDLVCTVEGFVHPDVFNDVMQSHQKVSSLVRQVGEIPSIAEHLQQHPYTVLSDMFSEPNFVKQTLEFVMFPCMKLALSSWLGLKYCFRSS